MNLDQTDAPDFAITGLVWPAAFDREAAERLVARFAGLGPACAALAASVSGAALLRAVGGNAPYLADLALRESASVCGFAAHGPDRVIAQAHRALAALAPDASGAVVARALRAAKRVIALVVALADIGGLWRLAQVTGALSDLADAALVQAVDHLLRTAHVGGHLLLPDAGAFPGQGSGFIVLAMGKLGGRELNYSSDIDLVLIHDPQACVSRDNPAKNVFIRMARDLVALLERRDADGYVFRTDLRLRPDPAATPPSVVLQAALAYYEGMAQNWERAAMLKARPVAGDLAAGADFLEAIRPFVWRRGLDFAALADLHAMKRRIDQHKGTGLAAAADPATRLLGHNLKLGQGGIREIEFVAQTLQLVWGGRTPGLRVSGTVAALRLLARAGRLGARAVGELIAAYRFLRRVEHRLQMVADRQTHSLPDDAGRLAAVAVFMGFANEGAFADTLLRHLLRVSRRYAEVFSAVPGGEGWSARTDALLMPASLAALGFGQPQAVRDAISRWQGGQMRALRSERARELLGAVLPDLLRAFGRQTQPDAAWARFDNFLGRLPAGVQLLSLFQRNPQLIARIAAVLGAAPSLADHLASNPAALDGLLMPPEVGRLGPWLATRLVDARLLEDAIGLIRRGVREEEFAISVATLEGRLDADAAGERRAALADAAIAALLPYVLGDVARRHGEVRGGTLAVVLLGKAGGREMMAGSDLDLMVIYDHPGLANESVVAPGGAGRAISAAQWFVRAVQTLVAGLTAPDAGGALYAIDMRLRPSGNKGPVAVSLAAFANYHRPGGEAWTWERMALTRARVVAGPSDLRARIKAAIRDAVEHAGPPARVRADAAEMRMRLLRDAPAPGPPYALRDTKLRPGGLIDVEFVAQVLQLLHVTAHPQVLRTHTGQALAALAEAGLLSAEEAAMLRRAGTLWRTVQGILRLTQPRDPAAALSEASSEALLHAIRASGVAVVDVAGLRAILDDTAGQVRAAFARHIAEIA